MGADVRFGSARWAGLAVALINTAPSERQEDLLTGAGQLRELLLAHDEPGRVDVDDRDLADARAARDALGAVFGARQHEEQVAALLNELLARTAQPRLVRHEGVPLHLHVDAPGGSWGGWLAASGAMALALLIAEHGTEVLGRCQAPGCAHVLLRTGPGPARRFCDNACASRTRVAAYRARQARGDADGPGEGRLVLRRRCPAASSTRPAIAHIAEYDNPVTFAKLAGMPIG